MSGMKPKAHGSHSFLASFREKNNLQVEYKPRVSIPVNPAFTEATNIYGYETCAFHIVVGRQDSGKTTLVQHVMTGSQERNIIPVFIDLENKFKWSRAAAMGLRVDVSIINRKTGEVKELTGEEAANVKRDDDNFLYRYEGDFLFVRPDHILSMRKGRKGRADDIISTEDVFGFIKSLHDDQIALNEKYVKGEISKEEIPSFCFIIDSHQYLNPSRYLGALYDKDGYIVDSDDSKTNNMVKTQENNKIISDAVQRVIKSTLDPRWNFTNTMFMISQVYEKTEMNIQTVKPSGGVKLFYACDTVTYLGGKGGAGSRNEYIVYSGKELQIGSVAKIEVEKGHIETSSGDISEKSAKLLSKGAVCITRHGYIANTKEAKDAYKKEHLDYFKRSMFSEEEYELFAKDISADEFIIASEGEVEQAKETSKRKIRAKKSVGTAFIADDETLPEKPSPESVM